MWEKLSLGNVLSLRLTWKGNKAEKINIQKFCSTQVFSFSYKISWISFTIEVSDSKVIFSVYILQLPWYHKHGKDLYLTRFISFVSLQRGRSTCLETNISFTLWTFPSKFYAYTVIFIFIYLFWIENKNLWYCLGPYVGDCNFDCIIQFAY